MILFDREKTLPATHASFSKEQTSFQSEVTVCDPLCPPPLERAIQTTHPSEPPIHLSPAQNTTLIHSFFSSCCCTTSKCLLPLFYLFINCPSIGSSFILLDNKKQTMHTGEIDMREGERALKGTGQASCWSSGPLRRIAEAICLLTLTC